MGKKGKNSSIRPDCPSKFGSLSNALRHELNLFRWESSVKGIKQAEKSNIFPKFLRELVPAQSVVSDSPMTTAQSPSTTSILQNAWKSAKEADHIKELAAAARWHYSSPRVRIAREALLLKLLQRCRQTLNSEFEDIHPQITTLPRLSWLSLECVSAHLKRYDVRELQAFLQNILEPSQVLQIAINAARFHTLEDNNIIAVTPHNAECVICPRDLTHVGFKALVDSFRTNLFVTRDCWEDVDMHALDIHKLVGPRDMYIIGSDLRLTSFRELKQLFNLQTLTLHAVPLPPDLPKLLSGDSKGYEVSSSHRQMAPDKAAVLGLMRAHDLSLEERDAPLVPGGSNPFVFPGSRKELNGQQSCFACAVAMCTLFLYGGTGEAFALQGSKTLANGVATASPVSTITPLPMQREPSVDMSKGFENLITLTLSHCKWSWTVESLLLIAYRLSAHRQNSSSGRGGNLGCLQELIVVGADIFEPCAGSAIISESDSNRLRKTCALFRSICSVKLSIDGLTESCLQV